MHMEKIRPQNNKLLALEKFLRCMLNNEEFSSQTSETVAFGEIEIVKEREATVILCILYVYNILYLDILDPGSNFLTFSGMKV